LSIADSHRGTAPIARVLACATTARDVERLVTHAECIRHGWGVEYDGDVRVVVTLTAQDPEGQRDRYTLTLDCDAYDVWPPEVKFVNPATHMYVVGQDGGHLPVIQGLPNFGLHAKFTSFHQSGRSDQLVCFSFTRGYYDSAHTPTSSQRWTQGRHWLYSPIAVLHRALQPPFYRGRSR
jgi:hypothetical protein